MYVWREGGIRLPRRRADSDVDALPVKLGDCKGSLYWTKEFPGISLDWTMENISLILSLIYSPRLDLDPRLGP